MKRVAVRLRDNELATDRLRGIGFRAESSSGWEGPTRLAAKPLPQQTPAALTTDERHGKTTAHLT